MIYIINIDMHLVNNIVLKVHHFKESIFVPINWSYFGPSAFVGAH